MKTGIGVSLISNTNIHVQVIRMYAYTCIDCILQSRAGRYTNFGDGTIFYKVSQYE